MQSVIQQNKEYYESTKSLRQLKRNNGYLMPCDTSLIIPDRSTCRAESRTQAEVPAHKDRVAIATRSMSLELYHLSGEFLNFEEPQLNGPYEWTRYRIIGTSALDYFQQLLKLDADWVVNIDEDAFLFDPQALIDLIEAMEHGGYSACGMPDGGVVPIRRHHPIACNAFFNIFDMRRVRRVWTDWQHAAESPYQTEFARFMAPFANRGPAAFDDFEPYYGLFFSILAANQKILYLEGEEWNDGISTLLKTPSGAPFLLHAWYAREWTTDFATRERYRDVIDSVHRFRHSRVTS